MCSFIVPLSPADSYVFLILFIIVFCYDDEKYIIIYKIHNSKVIEEGGFVGFTFASVLSNGCKA